MDGWISLHRKVRQSAVWQDPELFRLWCLCLLKATHKPHKQMIGNQTIELMPGQFVTGREALAEEYNRDLSPSKRVKPLTLWRWVQKLEKIGNLNIKSTNKYSVITIVNWSEYQQNEQQNEQQTNSNSRNEQQMNNKSPQNEQQMNNKISDEQGEVTGFDSNAYHKNEPEMNNKIKENEQKMITNNNNNNSFNNNDFWANIDNMELTPEQQLEKEIEEYYQAKRGKHDWPASSMDREWIKKAREEGFTRDEMIEGINLSFLRSNNVNSFEYCLKTMRTQRERRTKWNQEKTKADNVRPFPKRPPEPARGNVIEKDIPDSVQLLKEMERKRKKEIAEAT